jgi:hypothetical protein
MRGLLRGFAAIGDGLIAIFSFGQILPPIDLPPEQTVNEALAADWRAVGRDLRAAVDATCRHALDPFDPTDPDNNDTGERFTCSCCGRALPWPAWQCCYVGTIDTTDVAARGAWCGDCCEQRPHVWE